ncbi:hypothetical protein G3A43_38475 [Paraburkholderia aspalathi]|nr:hypothetical protein [Paraburkholderia aspalathi]MBK3786106.1 hypothetical protein [Paraburkholderia aspalathi]
MPDYPLFRDRLNVLARALRLTAENLPQPSAGPQAMDAPALKAMLQTLIGHGAKRGTARGKNAGLLGIVAQKSGYKESTIAGWLSVVDGSLKRPAAAVARLPGYAQARDDLQQLFTRLGHVETAASLPVSGEGTIQKMTAALLVDVLRAFPASGKAQLWKIGAAVGVDASCLALHVVPADGSLHDIGAVQRMPDYAQHREALADALTALGQHAQADALPLPLVDAGQFLQVLRRDLARIVAAMNALRSTPAVSPREAAMQADVHPEAFTAVIGDGGVVRERTAVCALLTHFHGFLIPGVEEQLDRLQETSLGKPVAAMPGPAMKRMKLPAQGTIPAKVFIVRSSTGDPGVRKANRLEKIYANNPDQVREPRSHEVNRARQMLRWQSTVLKTRYPESREIQSYYHAREQTIVVSSNLNGVNAQLTTQLGRGKLSQMAEALAGSCDI